MPAKRNPNRPCPQKPHCLIPFMHKKVSALLEADDLVFGFHDKDDPSGCVRDYDTNIKGMFFCRNNECPRQKWHSFKIAITIRMYPGAEYNARVYKQRCGVCEVLGHLILDRRSYTERVVYRIKKWCGVDVEPPKYAKEIDTPRHDWDRCEGCKAGRCKDGRMAESMAT